MRKKVMEIGERGKEMGVRLEGEIERDRRIKGL